MCREERSPGVCAVPLFFAGREDDGSGGGVSGSGSGSGGCFRLLVGGGDGAGVPARDQVGGDVHEPAAERVRYPPFAERQPLHVAVAAVGQERYGGCCCCGVDQAVVLWIARRCAVLRRLVWRVSMVSVVGETVDDDEDEDV